MARGRTANNNHKKNHKFMGFNFKDVVTSIIVPIIVVLITVFVSGAFQMKSINKTTEAQIKAAEITKVTKIEYDFKETNNWHVNESSDYMSLEKGNNWIYKGTYTFYSYTLKDYVTKDITLNFEIVEKLESNENKLFIVNNFPLKIKKKIEEMIHNFSEKELVSSKPIELLGEEYVSGLLLVANKLFFIPNEELENVKNYIKQPSKFEDLQLINSPPSLDYDNLIFEFPMFKGQRFGDLNSITREDMSHFWYVNDVRSIKSLKGSTYEEVQIFDLIYNTLPDQQTLIFRPYLGILSYSYIHNGTPDDFKISLSEFSIKNQ